MLAHAPRTLVMQTDSKIGLTELVCHATSTTLVADHGTTTSSAEGSEEVCVG
jgi:hypothetical protein